VKLTRLLIQEQGKKKRLKKELFLSIGDWRANSILFAPDCTYSNEMEKRERSLRNFTNEATPQQSVLTYVPIAQTVLHSSLSAQ